MSSLKAYLAEKYMSGPKADAILSRTETHKKKKRKTASDKKPSGSGQFIVQDDDGGWNDQGKGDDEDITEAVVEKDRSFKKRKTAGADSNGEGPSGWQTIREPTPPPAEDEKPLVVDDGSTSEQPKAGGLVSPEKLRSMLSEKYTKTEVTEEEIAAAQETVYRDATGRRIDTKAERAEAARKKREREEREAKKMEWGKGLVQRDEEERKKKQLELERMKDLAVYADDKELNEEQKAKERWNDPAAAFLTKKTNKGPRKPQYTGPPPPPNRYGIKPGYRWDGVDRSNGFEKKFFQKHNERKRSGLESYQWSVDDM